MIDIDEAYAIVQQRVMPGPHETIRVETSLGRTLAQVVHCDGDNPPFDRSLMDGYAVHAADTITVPVELKVIGTVNAGDSPSIAVEHGTVMQINTGAPIPTGADAVVRVEDTVQLDGGARVRINSSVSKGTAITPRGSYATKGQAVLQPGTVMGPLEIAVAVSAGVEAFAVYGRSSVAILTTGNELVEVGEARSGAMIRNSNRYLLDALVRDAHATPVHLGTAGDDRGQLLERVRAGLSQDVLCITGGVSMGSLDLVPDVLRDCGAAFHIHKMGIKPGRPIIFATAPTGCLIFALPGNPISAFVGFELLVRPALAAKEGRPGSFARPIAARLTGTLGASGTRRAFRPARLSIDEHGEIHATPLSWMGSGDPFGMATADALIMQPPGAEPSAHGARMLVIPLKRL